MQRKQTKPTYGNSQGSKSSELSSELGRKKSAASSAPQYAQSGEFTDRKNHKLRSNSATLTSLPRTIFKVGIIILILYPALVYTPIGKSITTRVSMGIAGIRQKIGGIQPEVELKNMGERRQKSHDDRINDALKKSGDDPHKK